MTEIQQQAIQLQKDVFENDYYVNLYCAALAKHNMSTATIDEGEHTDSQLVNMANTFWFALPDSMAIRREPFYLLCEIAEHCFDEDHEPDEDE